MKITTLKRIGCLVLCLAMLTTTVFGASITNAKYKNGVVTVGYYVENDDATIYAVDSNDEEKAAYIDQEEYDGSFSFKLPEYMTVGEGEGETSELTIKVGGTNEAPETVTLNLIEEPDAEDPDAANYSYYKNEEFENLVIDYKNKAIDSDSDMDISITDSLFNVPGIFTYYDTYAGKDDVLYVDWTQTTRNESLNKYAVSEASNIYFMFDEVISGTAKVSYDFLATKGSNNNAAFGTLLTPANQEAVAIVEAKGNLANKATGNVYTTFANTFADGRWHHVEYVIDVDARTYDIYFDEVKVGDTYTFNNAVAESFDKLQFRTYQTNQNAGQNSKFALANVTVKAQEENVVMKDRVTVTFYNDDATKIYGTKQVIKGNNCAYIKSPEISGHTFVNWLSGPNHTGAETTLLKLNANASVYSHFESKQSVTFYDVVKDINTDPETWAPEATPLRTLTVDYGASASYETEVPEGYSFKGWYKEDGTEADLSSVTESLVVYAKYVKMPVVTLYNKDGSTLSQEAVEYGASYDVPVLPDTEDTMFVGWVDETGEAVSFHEVTGDITAHPLFAAISESAIEDFEAMGSKLVGNYTGLIPAGATEDVYGETEITGFEKISVTSSGAISLIEDDAKGSIVLTDDTGFSINGESFKAYLSEVTPGSIVNVGYDFKVSAYGSIDTDSFGSIRDANGKYILKAVATGKDTLGYAIYDYASASWVKLANNTNWNEVEYFIDTEKEKVDLYLNGEYMRDFTYEAGAGLPAVIEFTMANGSSRYSIDNVKTNILVPEGAHVVTFMSESGTELYKTIVMDGKNAIYVGEAITKESNGIVTYEFDGWADAEGNLLGTANTVNNVTEDMVVYPHFAESAAVFQVKFLSEGRTITTRNVAYGSKLPNVTAPVKAEDEENTYVFECWETEDGVGIDEDTYIVTGAVILSARFTAIPKETDEGEYIEFYWGDITGDSSINFSDTRALTNYIRGEETSGNVYDIGDYYAENMVWGDIDCDSAVGIFDLRSLFNYTTYNKADSFNNFKVGSPAKVKAFLNQ
ncbi:MAG: InlB B-repeat-containing protein [Clostridia bacterium]|nr:InlB B-repeat-containing protein [Clostridia bacterium]